MNHYVNLSRPPIHLAPLRRVDREADKRLRRLTGAVKEWIEEDYGPEVKGRYGEPCPRCSQTRILFVPGREWWRCCGLRVNGSLPGITVPSDQ